MRIFVSMSEKAPNQASSKEDLDQLSALEESMAPFGMGDLDSQHGVILKDWSAQDFANIYVRFRPHLISHARKFLREETQAEEVVQDAFLYLMTALPELDSELGVLRFLKWKSKMLCLDIIRSSQAGINNNLVPLPDDVADETQPLDSLERADDAAIIRLALAKLNPRHREALIATMYEERSHEEVAKQMGVGENAFRQLLFRARASFRQGLVGEAQIEGKSVAEILSVAARKAARDSGKWASGLGVFLILTLSFASLIPTDLEPSEIVASRIAPPTSNSEVAEEKTADPPITEQGTLDQEGVPEALTGKTGQSKVTTNLEPAAERGLGQTEDVDPAYSTLSDSDGQDFKEESELAGLLTSQLAIELASELQSSEVVTRPNSLVIDSGGGLHAFVAIDSNSDSVIQYLVFEFSIGEHKLTAVPLRSYSLVDKTSNGLTKVSYAATDFMVGDFAGTLGFDAVDQAPFSRSGLLIEIVLDNLGSVLESKVRLLPRI